MYRYTITVKPSTSALPFEHWTWSVAVDTDVVASGFAESGLLALDTAADVVRVSIVKEKGGL